MHSDLLRTLDVFLDGAKRPLVVVVGPTASGKTALSIEIAKYLGGEIVNADSRQLYRMLDIGTAKITSDEMQGIRHHLIDVKNPDEEVTVGWFQEHAKNAIGDIHDQNKVPILAGGSMLYVSSIVDGMTFAPPVDPDMRARIGNEYDRDKGKVLYKKLQKVDPDAAACIHQNNRQYVIRAIEIYESHHMPKSAVVRRGACEYELLVFGMDVGRDVLIKRIVERTDAMFEAGWIDEVRALLNLGYKPGDPGMRSCGYREIMRYLAEAELFGAHDDPDMAFESLKKNIVAKTRQYAKRQMTWWRGDKRIRWISGLQQAMCQH